MSIQLIEIYSSKLDLEDLHRALSQFPIIYDWITNEKEDRTLLKIFVKGEHTEEVLNYLETISSKQPNIHVFLYEVKTYIPDLNEWKITYNKKKTQENDKTKEFVRASRHELYSIVKTSSETSISFTWFIILSTIVAIVGIIKNSSAIVIGAMVIAPLIGPFIATAFASVLGDYRLLYKSLLTSLYGLSIPFFIAAIFGLFFPLPIHSTEFLSRTNIIFVDIIAALASGAAGAISFVKQLHGTLVGVMVSIALLPPTIVFGMIVGAAQWKETVTPLLLLLININSIIFSAIAVFWLSGIQPIKWKEIKDANISKKYSLLFSSIIIIFLAIAIYLVQF
ncbi:TIGR00341 family protein [Bacillus sp. Marseille-P3661]|uniref:TIGR00341 family protein n=1 Tax=Bacillus sp. Marseille-P3661 TaxID=1936234 RepID=UPI000C840338|nr:TIGR00341 family protein [Bacillus sp. Marseille-P3661]